MYDIVVVGEDVCSQMKLSCGKENKETHSKLNSPPFVSITNKSTVVLTHSIRMCQNGMSVPAHPSTICFTVQDTLDPNYQPQVALRVLLVGILRELENMSTGGTPAQHVMQVNTQKQWGPPRLSPARTVKQVNTLWLQPAV